MNSINYCLNQSLRSVESYQRSDDSDVAVSGSIGNIPDFRSDEGLQRLSEGLQRLVEGLQKLDVRAVDVSGRILAKDGSNFIRDYPSRNESMTLFLHIAVFYGDFYLVDLLIHFGADVNQALKAGLTPLVFAADQGHLEMAEQLIRYGADVNQATEIGSTPLIHAAQCGHVKLVELLIHHRADLDHTQKNGKTALFFAAHNGHKAVVKCLLDAGADPKKKFKMFKICKGIAITLSPLRAARTYANDQEIVEMIKTAIKGKSVKPLSESRHLIGSQYSSYGTL